MFREDGTHLFFPQQFFLKQRGESEYGAWTHVNGYALNYAAWVQVKYRRRDFKRFVTDFYLVEQAKSMMPEQYISVAGLLRQ